MVDNKLRGQGFEFPVKTKSETFCLIRKLSIMVTKMTEHRCKLALLEVAKGA